MSKFLNKETLRKIFLSFVWVMILVVVIDQITKWAFMNYFGIKNVKIDNIRGTDKMITIIPGFLYIACALNTGAAWSLGANSSTDGVNPILLVISIVLSAVLIFYYIKTFKKNRTIVNLSLALMIGGAFGNMIDRAFYRESITNFKGVIDWIQVYFGNESFPTFNIADSALVVGVIILLVVYLIDIVKETKEKAKKGEYKLSPEERKTQSKNEEDSNH